MFTTHPPLTALAAAVALVVPAASAQAAIAQSQQQARHFRSRRRRPPFHHPASKPVDPRPPVPPQVLVRTTSDEDHPQLLKPLGLTPDQLNVLKPGQRLPEP